MNNIRVPGIDSNLTNVQPGDVMAVLRGQTVVTVVAVLMLDGLFGGIGEEHAPGPAGIVAAPQSSVSRIDSPGIPRVEGKGFHARTQIEHPPGLTAIVRDVPPGHVAVLHYQTGIVGADRGANCGSASARADDPPRIEARCRPRILCGSDDRQSHRSERKKTMQSQVRSHLRNNLFFPERQLS